MAYTPKDGSGALFKNDKGGVESRPDYRGDLRIEGVDYKLSAWIKKNEKGPYMSISAQPKDEQPQAKAPQRAPQKGAGSHVDEDVPFAARSWKEG